VRERLAGLIAALRRAAVRVSVAESIDAAAAVAAAGVERETLRDALAAALVKDERDRPIFEREFERVFPARVPAPAGRQRRARAAGESEGEGGGAGRGGGGGAGVAAAGQGAQVGEGTRAGGRPNRRPAPSAASEERPRGAGLSAPSPPPGTAGEELASVAAAVVRVGAGGGTAAEEAEHEAAEARRGREPSRSGGGRESGAASVEPAALPGGASASLLARRLRERALFTLPFRAMSARDVEEASVLVQALARRLTARLRRRLRPRVRGRLDFRRTLRAAIPHGGVPFERRFRGRRPGRLDLVALCDLSGSTAIATDFFLSLLAPAAAHFAHVRLFGFVDHLVEIEFAEGQVRPAGPLDLMARSDFGQVLLELMEGPGIDLTASTLLLVLGDARNNRRPPRADLLARARARVRRVLWLDPEPQERWNTGDSVIGLYARHADAVVPCGSLAELDRALAAVARL